MSLEYKSKMQAIEELAKFYRCPYDDKLQQPWFSREYESRTEWGLLCGHTLYHLPREEEVILGGHPTECHLTAETDGYRYTSHGRSFLTQYYNSLNNLMGGTYGGGATSGQTTSTDTGGTSRTLLGLSSTSGNDLVPYIDIAADATYGLVVGTGTSPNTGATVALGTLIATGNGAGQLAYGSVGVTTPSGTSPLSMTFTRTFTNNSGGNITINEAGMYTSAKDNGSTQRFFAHIRDVNAGGILTINNTANSTLTYTLSYTIS